MKSASFTSILTQTVSVALVLTASSKLAFATAPIFQDSADAVEEVEPEEEVPRGLKVNAAGAYQGYTIFSPILSGNIYLIDMNGEVVHTWETGMQPTGSVYLMDNGNLYRSAIQEDNPRFNGGGIGGRMQEITWDGEVVWDFELANDQQTQHHDIEVMPNGNLLLIAWEYASRDEAIQWGRDPNATGSDGLWPLTIQEIKPVRPNGAEVVWEWHAWDHMIQDFDRNVDSYGDVAANPGKIDINADHRDQPPMTAKEKRKAEELAQQMRGLGYLGGDDDDEEEDSGPEHGADWLHTNGIDFNAEHDLIVVCTPRLGELWVIDHSTTIEEAAADYGGRFDRGGELLYRWGNPRTYGRGADSDKRLFFQHNPEWIEGGKKGELRLTVFNNGGGRSGGDFSSVDELVLPFDPKRGFQRDRSAAFGPQEPAWSYSDQGNFFSAFISGANRLPNGNTLICSGAPGRIFEVTHAKEIVWEYLNPFGGDITGDSNGGNAPPLALFRATRIAPNHPGLKGRL